MSSVTDQTFERDGRFLPLDGVRAAAALLVVGFHCVAVARLCAPPTFLTARLGPVHRLLEQCWLGVDLFFVLSGFLIGRILLTQLAQGGISFRAFYIRRAFRIFPPYYLVLTCTLILFAPLASFAPLFGHTPWGTLVQRSPLNFLYLNNYVLGPTFDNAMPWSWSLCVEEHFYLLCPAFLAVLFMRCTPRKRLVGLAVLAVAPCLLRLAAFVRDAHMIPLGLYLRSHTHADGLLIGVLVAYLHIFRRDALLGFSRRFGWVGWLGAFICFAAVVVAGGTLARGFFPVVMQFLVLAVGGGLLIVNVTHRADAVAGVLARRVWQPIARYSYGMYLVNPFVIAGLLAIWPGGPQAVLLSLGHLGAILALATGLTIGVAAVLFHGVERRLIARGVRLSRPYLRVPAHEALERQLRSTSMPGVGGLSEAAPRS